MENEELLKSISFDFVAKEAFGQDTGSKAVLEAMREEMTDTIMKAMAMNSIPGGGGFGDLGPLRLEDLDATMSSVLFRKEHFVLQRWLARTPAEQLIYQFNKKLQYGNMRGRRAFPEGGGPGGSISRFSRHTAQIRFLGVQGGLTHQATMIKRGGIQVDPVAQENEDRTIELLGDLERQLMFGQAALTDSGGNVLEYDGLVKQIGTLAPTRNIFDLRGQPLDLGILDEIGLMMHDAYYTTDWSKFQLFSPGHVLTDLSKQYHGVHGAVMDYRELPRAGAVPTGYDPGSPFAGYTTQFGKIPFQPSVFMQPCPDNKPVAATTGAYGAATTIATAVPAANAASQMAAGTYFYFVAPLYDSGEAMPSPGVSATPTVGQQVAVTITRSTQLPELRGYRLYRGTNSSASHASTGWIADIGDSGAATTVFNDVNDTIPGTSVAVVLEGHDDNLTIAQLAPLMRFPLPPVKTLLPFYYLMYHTLVLKIGERQFLIKNIGRAA